ncbi:hypothetical protein SAMN02746065_1179 [Desulfocicer vacuolatum DSM 3385]|uniref:Uncharacterized protein n=1 Tax=Desulfocicer vacuolatum DSM 3385 TaxID=1121400 RepID=A0A1W2DDA5_9BACT|nr:hypothetical protein SAMN02746065_1179 [Desulfocicer vacuolatum DSM 3385]
MAMTKVCPLSMMLIYPTWQKIIPQRIMGRRRGAKWYYAAAPPTGNGPGPEL